MKMSIKRGVLIFFLVVLSIKLTYADTININPDFLRYENVLREGYASSSIFITTDSKSDIKVNFVATGDVSDWISITTKGSPYVSVSSPVVLLVSVRPGAGVSNGEHQGSIVFSFEDSTSSKVSSDQNRDVVLPISVYITDQQIKDAKIKNVVLDDVLVSESVILMADILNNGNVDIKPKIKAEIKNGLGSTVKSMELESDDTIAPTAEKNIKFNLGGIDVGDYILIVNFFLDDFILRSMQIPFNVVFDASQIRKISFVEIESRDKGHINDDFNVVAHVSNRGEDTSVRFAGEIYLDGKFLSEVSSDFVLVKSGQDTQIKTGFTPTKLGFYKIVGHLETPNLVSTQSKESAFEIVPSDVALQQIPLSANPVFAILLMLAAIFIFVRINKLRAKRLKHKGPKRKGGKR